MSKGISEFPIPQMDDWSKGEGLKREKSLLDWFSHVGMTRDLAEHFKKDLEQKLESCREMRDHCCQVFSKAMGMKIVNMKVDLNNHYTKEYCAETGKWEYSQFIVHFVEVRDDPNDPESEIFQTFEYKFSPRTRRGKILRHCYWILKMIAEIDLARQKIPLLYEDEQEWERDLTFGDI